MYSKKLPLKQITLINLDFCFTDPEPVTRPPLACGRNESTCSNGECVPKHFVCNGHYDCTDGSDEMRCSKFIIFIEFIILEYYSLH